MKRKRICAFDKFEKEIIECINAGMRVPAIFNRLDSRLEREVYPEALYCYITRKGLRKRIQKGNEPICDQCSNCQSITCDDWKEPRRLCMKEFKVITKEVTTSPMWCDKRK